MAGPDAERDAVGRPQLMIGGKYTAPVMTHRSVEISSMLLRQLSRRPVSPTRMVVGSGERIMSVSLVLSPESTIVLWGGGVMLLCNVCPA